ncbi:hypothetical protein Lfu02_15410 [Longispora fulva]|uniref:DUF6884 domain-containing protein n=1 Tax=Longispora fulva TaxID=619741 RepID=A0A8J7KMG2_9ACTN|nr:DUF6884 domain-containing protein [Longispora fulva]MBG6140449.1 hypothetical protein [Longispora fulva]GIG57169.1 hypothetical protein Lfu02_15410 [Longispora fulva]
MTSLGHLAGRRCIVACSAEKTFTTHPVPALDLYQGGAVPPLRARLGGQPALRSRVRILSAEHGLIGADELLLPYDRPLDADRAVQLRPLVREQLAAEESGAPVTEWLVIAEPLYLVLLADLLAHPARPQLHWVHDHAHGWPQAAAVLDGWGWP